VRVAHGVWTRFPYGPYGMPTAVLRTAPYVYSPVRHIHVRHDLYDPVHQPGRTRTPYGPYTRTRTAGTPYSPVRQRSRTAQNHESPYACTPERSARRTDRSVHHGPYTSARTDRTVGTSCSPVRCAARTPTRLRTEDGPAPRRTEGRVRACCTETVYSCQPRTGVQPVRQSHPYGSQSVHPTPCGPYATARTTPYTNQAVRVLRTARTPVRRLPYGPYCSYSTPPAVRKTVGSARTPRPPYRSVRWAYRIWTRVRPPVVYGGRAGRTGIPR